MPLQQTINHTFNDATLLERALTRKAYAIEQMHKNQPCEDQEVLRILGDAVLKAILVDLLMNAGCRSREQITNRKKDLEKRSALAVMARDFGIGQHIRLGKGEVKQKAHEEESVLAETMEAVVGAIYLDVGFDKTKKVIVGWFGNLSV